MQKDSDQAGNERTQWKDDHERRKANLELYKLRNEVVGKTLSHIASALIVVALVVLVAHRGVPFLTVKIALIETQVAKRRQVEDQRSQVVTKLIMILDNHESLSADIDRQVAGQLKQDGKITPSLLELRAESVQTRHQLLSQLLELLAYSEPGAQTL